MIKNHWLLRRIVTCALLHMTFWAILFHVPCYDQRKHIDLFICNLVFNWVLYINLIHFIHTEAMWWQWNAWKSSLRKIWCIHWQVQNWRKKTLYHCNEYAIISNSNIIQFTSNVCTNPINFFREALVTHKPTQIWKERRKDLLSCLRVFQRIIRFSFLKKKHSFGFNVTADDSMIKK